MTETEENYTLTKNAQYLVQNTETGETQVMEWRGISFRDKQNSFYFLGTHVPLRLATEDEKIKVQDKRKAV